MDILDKTHPLHPPLTSQPNDLQVWFPQVWPCHCLSKHLCHLLQSTLKMQHITLTPFLRIILEANAIKWEGPSAAVTYLHMLELLLGHNSSQVVAIAISRLQHLPTLEQLLHCILDEGEIQRPVPSWDGSMVCRCTLTFQVLDRQCQLYHLLLCLVQKRLLQLGTETLSHNVTMETDYC